jgi:hypothetical protein
MPVTRYHDATYIRNSRAVTTLVFACLARVKLYLLGPHHRMSTYQPIHEMPVTPVLPYEVFAYEA